MQANQRFTPTKAIRMVTMFKQPSDSSHADVVARALRAIAAMTAAPAVEPPEQRAPASEQPDSRDELLPYIMLGMAAACDDNAFQSDADARDARHAHSSLSFGRYDALH
ncbi:hypothetical protein FVF58_45180 [Paraburkholderia panacisoli]|uniref:Uncharacterized protein n=1 Tax=Paraburkholderia panacisoli TaxID=2603818 RepID=A0A5B0G8E0_9BURK|nr:hypothetical protein [Paraburkholderia panacisoli]KAA0998280.1 hypothetical protein FVF58_45180 [Paraburkholderia panacisoli]